MKQDIKLILCDIDSTILSDKREFLPYTREIIEQAHANGIAFGVASGRPWDELKRCAKDWGLSFEFDVVIGMNGAELYDGFTNKRYDYFLLKREWIKEIIELMSGFEHNPMMYIDGYILCDHMNEMMKKSAASSKKDVVFAKSDADFYKEENAKIMFRVEKEIMPEIEEFVAKHPSEYYQGFKTQPTLMEFCDKRISKGYAVKKISEIENIPLENIIVFGDTTNDNSMIEVAGHGVCLLNGSEDTKQIADEITEFDNNNDGVAKHLVKYYL